MGTKETMTKELAIEEIKKWLDFKRILPKEREEKQPQTDILVDAMQSGSLILNEDHSLTQILRFELETVKELTYKARLTVGEINAKLRGIDSSKAHDLLVAYVSVATGSPMGIIKQLDSNDYKVAQAINMFFL